MDAYHTESPEPQPDGADPAPLLRARALRTRSVGPIDLQLRAGECVCLRGESGSGKSLLLRALADLDPHDGEVLLAGALAASMSGPEWRRQVALLAADSPWWEATVGRHFRSGEPLGLQSLGFSAATMGWSVERLSSGERQRLALLRLLDNRPRVLLLDEPTANLDPIATQRVEQLLQEYRRDSGAALLWVSHDPAQIGRVAGRAFALVDGHITEVER